MSFLATAANLAWWATCQPAYRSFGAALNDPRRVQLEILQQTIAANAGTAFGREHDFVGIDSVERFRERVPLRSYDSLGTWMDRIAAGERSVLTSEPVLRLTPTSGSTAARKLVPFTRSLQRQFNNAISPWIADLFRIDPTLLGGCAYWSITPATKANDNAEFADDSAYLGGARQRLVNAILAVPADAVRGIEQMDRFRHVTIRHLLARKDLRLISVWHPSFLELLLDYAEAHWDEFDIPRLRSIDRGDYARAWPNLSLVSCWADAHAAGPAEALSRRLPRVRMQPKGLLATEAFISIPFAGSHPLAIRSHFVEFIDDAGRAWLADEVRRGWSYSLAVTTAGGLYRYRLGDRVRVEGSLGRTPSLRFVGRDDRVVDRFGEKLNERFVAGVIDQTLRGFGMRSPFAMLAPDGDRYALYLELDAPAPPALAGQLDAALRENPHYDYCRELGQLARVEIVVIEKNAYAIYAGALAESAGMRWGDIKPAALNDRLDWSAIFGVASRRQERRSPAPLRSPVPARH